MLSENATISNIDMNLTSTAAVRSRLLYDIRRGARSSARACSPVPCANVSDWRGEGRGGC